MDLHLDDAVAQGNSMLSTMKGENHSVMADKQNQFNNWMRQAGVDKGIKDKASSATAISEYVGNTGEFGMTLGKEGKQISTIGLSKYAGEQLAGAAEGASKITGVSAAKSAYSAYKTATFTPKALSSVEMVGSGANPLTGTSGVTVAGRGDQAAQLTLTGKASGGLGAATQEGHFSGMTSGGTTATSTEEALQGTGLTLTGKASGAAGGVEAVGDVSKAVGGTMSKIGGAIGKAAESGVGKSLIAGTKVLGGAMAGVNLAQDFAGGKFHIAGDNSEEKASNVSGMVSGGLDVLSLAVPVLAPFAAAAGLFSAIEGGIGAIEESHDKTAAAKGKASSAMKDPTPVSASSYASAGLDAQASSKSQTGTITGSF